MSIVVEEERLPAPDTRPVIVSSTVSDAHSWNLVYLQLLIEELGYQVVNLGPCVPEEELIEACSRLRPTFVVLSSVNGHGGQDGLRLIRRLRTVGELGDLPIVIGGKLGIGGTDPQIIAELAAAGFDAVFDDNADGPVLLRRFVRGLDVGELRELR
ncbi:cobalamin B12-binding domain-containing protein [Streptomyces sp. NBC_01451]|uniref:cobalamin B12-binding domain-containing protein n=1 Tax=Streptomyces sp. NBC_01451 TaxID=2903872 RepID=UPI002E329E99|nr:cobalamin-dependent protein [Streptomyces sp. NBC_01451]